MPESLSHHPVIHKQEDGLARITLKSPASRDVKWVLNFN
jgi:hypothetical protein